MRGGIDRPDRRRARTVRQMFRDDPGLWYDVIQALALAAIIVASIIGVVFCCI